MKTAGNIIIALTALVCLAALAISVYPGMLSNILFMAMFLSCLIVPFGFLAAIVAFILLARRRRLPALWAERRRFIFTPLVILLATFIPLLLYVPRRFGFETSRHAFDNFIATSPAPTDATASVNMRLGIYHVDKWGVDPRGGTYLRVYDCADGISPDCVSFGFCHKPNPSGTPFGAAYYEFHHLRGDWYWFCASDDWY